LVQGDTLFLNSKYAEYSGNAKKALPLVAFMSSTDATLATDTINLMKYSRSILTTKGTIVNKDNTLISKSGRYYVSKKISVPDCRYNY
jgi:hypothetical protein